MLCMEHRSKVPSLGGKIFASLTRFELRLKFDLDYSNLSKSNTIFSL